MCGIAGYYNLDDAPADVAILKRMIDIQRHRGPDDQGMRLFSLNNASSAEVECDSGGQPSFEGALGFNRLSILDLSYNGHQPMVNAAANIIIAYNGEVYNAFDFRSELETAGYQFRSRTDTEVLLYLYQHFGLEGMLERLRGMFAFCIVDLRKGELLIARDHLGIKPLYYSIQNGTLMFASEVKSFLPHPRFEARLSEDDLDEYLSFRYCAGERFLLRDVRQLRPGHYLRLRREDSTPQVTRYWSIPDCTSGGPESLDEAVNRLEALLKESVKSHLISDVKLGCQLSGGIDSSLVACFARSHFNADLETFSIDFEKPNFSEAHWVSQAATAAGATSHRFMLDDDTMLDDIDAVTWHLDRPASHSPAFGLFHLGRHSSQSVTVLLSGEGSDELLGGYSRFYQAAVRQRFESKLQLAARLPVLGPRLERKFRMRFSAEDAFILSTSGLRPRTIAKLRPAARTDLALAHRQEIFAEGNGNHLANCQKYALQTYLVELLMHQDKMTMAHSVENRVPFVDVAMVEAVRGFPTKFMIGDGVLSNRGVPCNTKICLKKLARRIFDERFVYRRKMGFPVPLKQALKRPAFKEPMADRILPGMRQRGWFEETSVNRFRDQFLDGHTLPRGFWPVAALEIWAQKFIDYSPDDH